MKIYTESPSSAPAEDPGLDVPLTIHRRAFSPANEALVIFVHGLGGSRYGKGSTWGSFPAYLYEDLPSVDVGLYRYRTLVKRLFSSRSIELETEAVVFADIIRDLTAYKQIILVGHSMGGLLCKALIWRLVESDPKMGLPRVRGLFLMATPQLGSIEIPRFLWWLTADARALRPHGSLITRITEGLSNHISARLDETVSDRKTIPAFAIVAASDQWVDRLSAGFDLPSSQQKNVIGSHTSIVKPASKDSDAYSYVLTKIQLCLNRAPDPVEEKPLPPPPMAPGHRYKLIAFDLDGTLIRGLDFSWTLVWKHLQFPDEMRRAGMLRYRRKEITYKEWCEWACRNFRSKGLRKQDFGAIVKDLTVTRNLHQAIRALKDDNFVVAIISGGIDTFLYELIPEADKLFDHIYINKLKFDPDGLIAGVEATPYDFEGKAAALELMCKEHGIALGESVFVGEGFNDEHVVNKAGLAIAYPPNDHSFSTAASLEIKEDDLMQVVAHVV